MPRHIGVENRPVVVGALFGQRARPAFRAGVVDGDVEAPETRDCAVDEDTHLVFHANVGTDEFGLCAGFA